MQTSLRPAFMQTDRLLFGNWRDDDMALASAIWGDAAVTRLTGGPFDEHQVAARLGREIDNLRRHGIQYWPLFDRSSHTLVGCCGLRPRLDEKAVFEFGFQLCQNAWGRGYATEAALAVIAWCRDNDVVALIAGHHPENHPSRKALLGLGFTYTHDELYPPTGGMEPCYRLPIGNGG